MKKIWGWVGFVDGKIYKERDSDCEVLSSQFFKSKKAARKYFKDVRKAALIVLSKP